MASRSGTPPPRPHPRKRTAERRRDLRMQRLHLRRRPAGRRLDLATMHPAVLAPVLRRNAAALDTQWTQRRRLLVRQTLQKRRQFRMAELRVPYLLRHVALFCPRPDARRPPCAGLRKPPRDRSMLNPAAPDCNPRTQNPSHARKREATRFHKKWDAPPQNPRGAFGLHPACAQSRTVDSDRRRRPGLRAEFRPALRARHGKRAALRHDRGFQEHRQAAPSARRGQSLGRRRGGACRCARASAAPAHGACASDNERQAVHGGGHRAGAGSRHH